MKKSESEKQRTCTLCKSVKQTYSEIVYSQGNRVCTDCKKITKSSDDMAFDRYINNKE